MFKIAQIALVTTALVVGAASTAALAVTARGVTAGEGLAREMLKLMDTDKNGRVTFASQLFGLRAQYCALLRLRMP